MFLPYIKYMIAEKVQDILQDIDDDELPEGEIQFLLHVDGEDDWSWANILNNGAPSDLAKVPPELIRNTSV